MSFSYFDPKTEAYRTLKTEAHTLRVSGVAQSAQTDSSSPSTASGDTGLEPVSKEEVGFVAKDIRFIKTIDDKKRLPERELYRRPLYWILNGVLFLVSVLAIFFSSRRATDIRDSRRFRLRRSHGVAKARLKAASRFLKESKHDVFYEEVSKAVHGYFADKFNISPQSLTQERLEALASEFITAEQMNKIKKLFDETSMGRFAKVEKTREDMQELYDLADEVISLFEKVKIK
jgi:hypothetical protein